jgi:hypothetical protein
MEKEQNNDNALHITTRLKQIFILIFATVAFFMTAYATSGGARMFLTETYAWVGITALAVGFLAFTSLVLGDGISSRRISQIALVMPFYLIAVALCWISSFASYHQQFLSVGRSDLANAETNLRQMGIYAHDISQDMSDQFQAQREALLNSEALTNYSIEMATLTDELQDRNRKKEIASELQDLIEAKKIELISRQTELETRTSDLKRELASLSQRVDGLEVPASQHRTRLDFAETLLKQLDTALKEEEGDPNVPFDQRAFLPRDSLAKQLVDDPACDRRRRAGTGGGAPGTCYNALSEKLSETRDLRDESQQAYDAVLSELKSARQRQAELQVELQSTEAQLETAQLQASEGLANGYAFDADGFLQSVNAFVDKPSQATFKQTADYCEVVTEVLADLDSVSVLPACAPQSLMAVFQQIDTIDADQIAFGPACDEADRREAIIDGLRNELLEVSGPERLVPITRAYDIMRRDVLETCVAAAEQRGLETTPYREDLASLYDRINPSQDPISKAIGKVDALFTGTASARDYFPALLALLQELSLLLSKLFWDASSRKKASRRPEDSDVSDLHLDAKPDDPASVLAAKNLLLNSTYHKNGHLLPHLFDEDYSHEMRSHMRLIVDSLFRKELASKSAKGILISEAGVADIARRIRRHNATLAAENVEQEATAEIVELEQSKEKKTPAAGTKPAVKSPTDQQSLEPDAIEPDEAEATDPDDPEPHDQTFAQRPRKRRPVVVRPNFRREV